MKKNTFSLIIFCLISHLGTSQVLFSENFDSYSSGHLNTDYTGGTIGKGGWILLNNNTGATAMVTPETGKGNVLAFSSSQNGGVVFIYKKNVTNNLTAGNKILKLEYEMYVSSSGAGNIIGGLMENYNKELVFSPIMSTQFRKGTNHIVGAHSNNGGLVLSSISLSAYNTWIKVEMVIDYNTNKYHYYLPLLNINKEYSYLTGGSLPDVEDILFVSNFLDSSSVVKLDNIKLSGMPKLPTYLSTDNFLEEKFNIFPNPASNVVNITNSENISVKQVEIYDLAGKLITSQNLNNETKIQLNVETLTSGTYLLHLQTNEGTAVKQLIKK